MWHRNEYNSDLKVMSQVKPTDSKNSQHDAGYTEGLQYCLHDLILVVLVVICLEIKTRFSPNSITSEVPQNIYIYIQKLSFT